MYRTVIGLMLILASFGAQAALLSRLSGQAYYDDLLNISWVTDANLARTSGYDADGRMTWSAAQVWITSLNTVSHLGVSNWRLPTVTDTGPPGCTFDFSGTDCGYNVDLSTGEMAHLFYSTLGNTGYYDTSGTPTGCSPSLPQCLTNDGPFSNLQPYVYWAGMESAPGSGFAWFFGFYDGSQRVLSASSNFNAWAVVPGDIGSAVPIPAALWLLGSALGVLGVMRREKNGVM